MRILHTADLHIGKQLRGRCLLSDQDFILNELRSIILTREIDVLIIAGDIYDTPSIRGAGAAIFSQFVTSVCNHGVSIICVSGNHDSSDKLGFASQLLAKSNFHIITTINASPIHLEKRGVDVEFYAMPHRTHAWLNHDANLDEKTLTDAYRAVFDKWVQPSDRTKIFVGHCHVVGGAISDSEREIETVKSEVFAPFDYVALGHLHEPQTINKTIRYSGSPLKYSKSEAEHTKSVTIVTVDNQGVESIEEVPLTPHRDLRVLTGTLNDVLSAPSSNDFIYVELEDEIPVAGAHRKLKGHFQTLLGIEQRGLIPTDDASSTANISVLDLIEELHQKKFNQPIDEALLNFARDVINQYEISKCD